MDTKVCIALYIIALLALVKTQNQKRCKPKFSELPKAARRPRGRYPTRSIERALNRNKNLQRLFEDTIAAMENGFCSRSVTAFHTLTVTSFRFKDTCPVDRNKIYTIPARLRQTGTKKCWVLKEFVDLKCPYVKCKQDLCSGEKGALPSPFGCVPTNVVLYPIYVWCPNPIPRGPNLQKWVLPLPQCCSCMMMDCRIRP